MNHRNVRTNGAPAPRKMHQDGTTAALTDTLTAALGYAALGYPVFALAPNAKRPHPTASPNGFHDATTDPEIIRSWPRNCNIGIAPPAHVLVLDLDVAKDDRPLGERRQEALNRRRYLERTYSEVAAAPLVRTPSAGWHFWLRLRPDAPHLTCGPFPGNSERWGELRGLARSYVAVWPSTIDGATYTWVRPLVRP